MKPVSLALTVMTMAGVSSSCAATTAASEFAISKSSVGQTVEVCGYQFNSRIYPTKDREGRHYEVMEYGDVQPFSRSAICVSGEVVWLGCESGTDFAGQSEIICVDASSDFGLRDIQVKSNCPTLYSEAGLCSG